jgi:hypothetical protein
MKMKIDENLIYIYKIDFGGYVDTRCRRECGRAVRSCKKDIYEKYGIFNSYLTWIMSR